MAAERRELAEFDAVFMRKDPPVDVDYLHACHLLELAERQGVLVINRPWGLRSANEKLFALRFPEWIPETLVTADSRRILEFLQGQEAQRCIIKPVDGHGGEGVLVLDATDRNKNALIEISTRNGTQRAVCQQYLPEARLGDKRILVL